MTTRPVFDVTGMRVTVAGGARSGAAAARLLVGRGARVTVSDASTSLADADRLRAAGVSLELGAHQEQTFTSADLIVLSPGVPFELPPIAAAHARGVPIIGELELASRWLRGRMVAITGTKGKSTTTELTGRILEAGGYRVTVGGNIGNPLSAQVSDSSIDMLHVVEASSFQLEHIDTFHPWIAVLLNFSPDHLDRHATVEVYAAAKARIVENQERGDWVVVNADDPGVLAMARRSAAAVRLFARQAELEDGTTVDQRWIVDRRAGASQRLVPLDAVHLIGPHLISDVMAAVTVGAIAGVAPAAMTAAVDAFSGLEHAMEPVATIGGVRFVNDSKATNVESALRSIESFGSGLVAILGGRFKGGDLKLLREPLAARASAVVAIGEAAPMVAEALHGAVPIRQASTLRDAVRAAFGAAAPGGVVLLAPACASFDMFRDYADRGRQFKREIQALASELGGGGE